MSASASMSSSASPSPTESERPRPTETGVHIPTSTVISIGAGFVAFALCVLGVMLLIRLIKLLFKSRRENTPFRTAWEAQGGFFGWIHGVGARDRELERRRENDGYLAWLPASGIGGGGWYASEVARMRMWNDMNLRRAGGGGGLTAEKDIWEGQVPAMWEVDIDAAMSHAHTGDDAVDLTGCVPIAVSPINMPAKNVKESSSPTTPARVRLSLLIALPSPEMRHKRMSMDTDDEEGDLPDMIIGSTVLSPTIRATAPASAAARHRTAKKGVMEISHIEDRDMEVRGARWTRQDDRWHLEGLDGDVPEPDGKAG